MSQMNWRDYQKFLDQKIKDAWYNFEFAEKKYNEASAAYKAAMAEKEAFEKALDERVGEKN